MNIFIEWIIRFFWMNIFWINNQFYFWMNILLNEYFRFDFELNIELNHFLARFNVWMNNQNKLNSASGVQRGEVSEGDFSPCFWESFPYSLSYSTLFTGFHLTFWNYIILNHFDFFDNILVEYFLLNIGWISYWIFGSDSTFEWRIKTYQTGPV